MSNRIVSSLVILVLLLGVAVPDVLAQNKRTGTAAATELLIPVGARDLAMGGSTVATTKGIEALYWNPAGIARSEQSTEAMVSQLSYIADIAVNYGAVATSFEKFGTVAVSLKTLSFGDITLTTNEDPYGLSGKIYTPTFLVLGVTYSNMVTDAIAVGITTKVVTNTIDRVSASTTAFDFGVQYTKLVGIKGLCVGVAVKNIGPAMKFDGSGLYVNATPNESDRPSQRFKIEAAGFDLATQMEIGLGYESKLTDNMLYSVNGTFTNDNLWVEQYHFGGELGFIANNEIQLFARAGYQLNSGVSSEDNVFGPAFGFGVNWTTEGFRASFDYAYRTAQYFDGNNVIALRFGF